MATIARTQDNPPYPGWTPVPDLIAEIKAEGGLYPWLSSRTAPDSWDKLTAALDLVAAAGSARILRASLP